MVSLFSGWYEMFLPPLPPLVSLPSTLLCSRRRLNLVASLAAGDLSRLTRACAVQHARAWLVPRIARDAGAAPGGWVAGGPGCNGGYISELRDKTT